MGSNDITRGRELAASGKCNGVDAGSRLKREQESRASTADEPTKGSDLKSDQDVLAEMIDGAWLDNQVFPPLEFTVPGLIPAGLGLLVAPPKAGKSWMVAGIGLASAAGGKAFGRIPVEQRPVLYLALEDGHRRLQDRFRTIMAGQPIPAAIHVIIRARTHEVIPMITEFLRRHRKALVVLDTLGKVKPPKRGGEDSYQLDYAIGSQLKEAIDSAEGSTLLVVHHSRKAESADFVDSVSGTQGIAGSADFVLVLARRRHSDEATLAVTGRDITEAEYGLTTAGGLWTLDGESLAEASETARTRREAVQLGDRSGETLAFVNGRSDTRPSDLAAHLGIDNDVAGKYLRRLHEADRIAKAGRGLYKPLSEVSEPSEMEVCSDTSDGSDTDSSGNVPPRCRCGTKLILEDSIKSGQCLECCYSGGADR